MKRQRELQNQRSATWSAYGDALGFITELADAERLLYRVGHSTVSDTVSWQRKIGGAVGINVRLPAGAYSDDTQLRLATGRAIRSDGTFDVAAFAKVELPAWANYALGAGAGSRAAAANLARTSATWYSNFFNNKRTSYANSGGNGAAMRIQPHVWAARNLQDTDAIILNVVRNAICTHGHLRGILGACYHALTLLHAMRHGKPSVIGEAHIYIEYLRSIPELILSDGDMRLLWAGSWEKISCTSLRDATDLVLGEMMDDIRALINLPRRAPEGTYRDALRRLDLQEPLSRGSGTKTAILAAYLCELSDINDPQSAISIAANALGSDTDSIATMVGAILGCCTEVDCKSAIQDRDYIVSEALRFAAIAEGSTSSSFRYPDLRSWKPERTAIDAIGLVGGKLSLNGLGELEKIEGIDSKYSSTEHFGWYRLLFGQTILAKVRSEPGRLSAQGQGSVSKNGEINKGSNVSPPPRLNDLFSNKPATTVSEVQQSEVWREDAKVSDSSSSELFLSQQLERIIASGFSPDVVGRALLQQAETGRLDFVERGSLWLPIF